MRRLKQNASPAFLGRKRGQVAPEHADPQLGAVTRPRSATARFYRQQTPNTPLWPLRAKPAPRFWPFGLDVGGFQSEGVSMAERYISTVMRIIEPKADPDPDDQRIINTWVRNQRSEHTRGVYRRDAGKLLTFTGQPLRAIALDDLQAFASELAKSLAPISVGRTLAAVRSLMRFACRTGHLTKNVAADLNLPRSENRLTERILAEADVQRIILQETEPRNRVLLLLLYTAGLRVSEACGLRWRNLRARGDAGQLTVCGKGGKTRAVLLPAAMWNDMLTLDSLRSLDAPVFRSRTGKALDRSRVLRIVQGAAKRAGVDGAVSPHWLRHAHATHSLERGAPIHLVQATLGHASVATTSRYLHARPTQSSATFIVAR